MESIRDETFTHFQSDVIFLYSGIQEVYPLVRFISFDFVLSELSYLLNLWTSRTS